jgi:hypothetical protein
VRTITRILCPIDFSKASAHAVEQAIALARWSGAALTALHVEEPIFAPVPALPVPADRISDLQIDAIGRKPRSSRCGGKCRSGRPPELQTDGPTRPTAPSGPTKSDRPDGRAWSI